MQINGLVLGKYRIEKLINNGSFASVFRAREELTGRIVAIKALPKSIYPPERLRYLLTELSAMTLNWGHENIVSIHTVEPGEDDYVAYIVMEYIDGPTLYDRMSTESFAPTRAINIALDICRGFIAVHARNIIHRDIKPQNILLTSDYRAKISDFGVARILEATNDLAETLTGTRKYMAPEQYDGEYDYRVDLYSLGFILYEMLTGRFPFRGKNHNEIKMKKLDVEVDFSNELPDEFSEFLYKVLHRDVNVRYQTATEMYEDLNRIRESWYERSVRNMLSVHEDLDTLHAKLSKDRKELRISTDVAEKIELELRYDWLIEEERRKQDRLGREMDTHYELAIQCLNDANPVDALQEVQKAHRLHSMEVEHTKKTEEIFLALSDALATNSTPSTANELADLIRRLSANEFQAFEAWFTEHRVQGAHNESTDFSDSGSREARENGSFPHIALQPTPVGEPPAEVLLRTLHEDPRYPHEVKAARILNSAEQNARVRTKRARSEYKKLGDFYRQAALAFVASEDWERVADCYVRARFAYIAARRFGSARQIAHQAGIYYSKFAEDMENQQRWTEAGGHYIFSAEHYTHGESVDAADESRLRATICYLNAAEDARTVEDIQRIYDYCEKIFSIAKTMQRSSKAVTAARKLVEETENSFAKPSRKHLQLGKCYSPKSDSIRGTVGLRTHPTDKP